MRPLKEIGVARQEARASGDNGASLVVVPDPTELDTDLFYIRDTRQTVGNSALWWGRNGSGYVTELDRAGLFSRSDALRIAANRSTDVPYAKSDVEAIAALHVRVEALYAVEPLTGGEP